jgi:hypothetical protein
VKLGTVLTLLGRYAEGDKELDTVIDGNVGNEVSCPSFTPQPIKCQHIT